MGVLAFYFLEFHTQIRHCFFSRSSYTGTTNRFPSAVVSCYFLLLVLRGSKTLVSRNCQSPSCEEMPLSSIGLSMPLCHPLASASFSCYGTKPHREFFISLSEVIFEGNSCLSHRFVHQIILCSPIFCYCTNIQCSNFLIRCCCVFRTVCYFPIFVFQSL